MMGDRSLWELVALQARMMQLACYRGVCGWICVMAILATSVATPVSGDGILMLTMPPGDGNVLRRPSALRAPSRLSRCSSHPFMWPWAATGPGAHSRSSLRRRSSCRRRMDGAAIRCRNARRSQCRHPSPERLPETVPPHDNGIFAGAIPAARQWLCESARQ